MLVVAQTCICAAPVPPPSLKRWLVPRLVVVVRLALAGLYVLMQGHYVCELLMQEARLGRPYVGGSASPVARDLTVYVFSFHVRSGPTPVREPCPFRGMGYLGWACCALTPPPTYLHAFD